MCPNSTKSRRVKMRNAIAPLTKTYGEHKYYDIALGMDSYCVTETSSVSSGRQRRKTIAAFGHSRKNSPEFHDGTYTRRRPPASYGRIRRVSHAIIRVSPAQPYENAVQTYGRYEHFRGETIKSLSRCKCENRVYA